MYTTIFIIASIGFTLTAGSFFGMLYHANTNRKGKSKVVITILIAVLIGCLIGGVFTTQEKNKDLRWNNGTHAECGGTWKIFDIEESHQYFKCEKCEKIEKF